MVWTITKGLVDSKIVVLVALAVTESDLGEAISVTANKEAVMKRIAEVLVVMTAEKEGDVASAADLAAAGASVANDVALLTIGKPVDSAVSAKTMVLVVQVMVNNNMRPFLVDEGASVAISKIQKAATINPVDGPPSSHALAVGQMLNLKRQSRHNRLSLSLPACPASFLVVQVLNHP